MSDNFGQISLFSIQCLVEIIELCDSFDQLMKLQRLVNHLFPTGNAFRDILISEIASTRARLLPQPVIGGNEVDNAF